MTWGSPALADALWSRFRLLEESSESPAPGSGGLIDARMRRRFGERGNSISISTKGR